MRFPDFYGIDTPNQNNLLAANKTIEEIKAIAGCDYLGFLSQEGMITATNADVRSFNLSAFNGIYPVSIGKNAASIRTPKDWDSKNNCPQKH